MNDTKRHYGYINNTGHQAVIIWNQIPQKLDSALIVEPEKIPDSYRNMFLNIVATDEAQRTENLSEILSKRIVPETNIDILSALHGDGLLRSELISNITVVMNESISCPLQDIVNYLNNKVSNDVIDEPTINNVVEKTVVPVSNGTFELTDSEKVERANQLIEQANVILEQAYSLVPSMRPVSIKLEDLPSKNKGGRPRSDGRPNGSFPAITSTGKGRGRPKKNVD